MELEKGKDSISIILGVVSSVMVFFLTMYISGINQNIKETQVMSHDLRERVKVLESFIPEIDKKLEKIERKLDSRKW